MSGERLFGRFCRLQIGTVVIETQPPPDLQTDEAGGIVAAPSSVQPLRVDFDCERSTSKEPNEATVSVYNLNQTSRQAAQEKNNRVRIEAGYVDNFGQIFEGDLTFSSTIREGSDWVTTFQIGDGERQFKAARINQSFAPGAQTKDILTALAQSMGVSLGNAIEEFKKGGFKNGFNELVNGATLTGRSSELFQKYMKSAGLEYSIQNGALQVIREGQTLTGTVELLSPETGLIGSPEAGEDGVVTAKSLLRAAFQPGQRIRITARAIDGEFKIQKLRHSGSTRGNDWFTELECKAVT